MNDRAREGENWVWTSSAERAPFTAMNRFSRGAMERRRERVAPGDVLGVGFVRIVTEPGLMPVSPITEQSQRAAATCQVS